MDCCGFSGMAEGKSKSDDILRIVVLVDGLFSCWRDGGNVLLLVLLVIRLVVMREEEEKVDGQ